MKSSSILVHGIGVKGMQYPAWKDGKNTREYVTWEGMLNRCTQKYWDKFPTYIGTICSDSFKSYSYFYEWCQKQVGFGNKDENGKIWQLDKDILIKGNKLYSEDTCVFVPQRVNYLLIKSNSTRGEHPIGVSKHSKCERFTACCNSDGKLTYIGSFRTPEEAFMAYKEFKESSILSVAENYKDKIDRRVYDALLKYVVELTD